MKYDEQAKSAVKALKKGLTGSVFADTMQALGFKAPTNDFTSKGLVWLGENFVIKSSHFENRQEIPNKKFLCPTRYLGVFDCENWFIQPRCKAATKRQFDAAAKAGYFDAETLRAFDVHEENVGLHNGKMVIFDW